MSPRGVPVDSANPNVFTNTAVAAASLANDAESIAGTVADKAVTPAGLAAVAAAGFEFGAVLMDVLDPSGARYAVRQATGTFESGTYSDTTMNIGYNVSGVPGVKSVAGQPMLFLQWESKYRLSPSDPYLSEFHLNFNGTNGALTGILRPIALTIEHATHIVDMSLVADTFAIYDHLGVTLMNFGAGYWYLRKSVIINGGTSAASEITIGEAGWDSQLIFNCATAKTNTIQLQRNGTPSWRIYDAASNDLYIRDDVNSKMHISLIRGATAAAAYTDFQSNIRVYGSQVEAGPAAAKAVVGSLGTTDAWLDAQGSNANIGINLRSKGTGAIISLTRHQFNGNVGFYGATPVAKPTGVAVTAAGIHAALVTLGLIAA